MLAIRLQLILRTEVRAVGAGTTAGKRPIPSPTTRRRERALPQGRFGRSRGPPFSKDAERLSHGPCSSQRGPEYSSSHPLLSDEIHPDFRRQLVPNEMSWTVAHRSGVPA